jgi:phage host-nuclease inhibitor protein Gam
MSARQLESWEDVDQALGRIGAVDLSILHHEAKFGEQLHELITDYAERLAPLRTARAEIEEKVSEFCRARKPEFIKKRSRQLTFGKIAFRVAEKIEIAKGFEAVVIATLKKLGWSHCVKVEERVDKDALKKLSDNDLAKAGVARRKEDHFRIEPNLEVAAGRVGMVYEPPAVTVDLVKLAGAVMRKSA